MYKQDPDLCPLGLITALWWGIGEREVDIRQIITALHETMAQVHRTTGTHRRGLGGQRVSQWIVYNVRFVTAN